MKNTITIQKVCSLVLALCKLHNFCINCRRNDAIEDALDQDLVNLTLHSNIELVDTPDNPMSPVGI